MTKKVVSLNKKLSDAVPAVLKSKSSIEFTQKMRRSRTYKGYEMNYLEILYKKYKKTTITKKEVAEELSISIRTLNRMIENNDLPIASVKPNGGKIVYPIKSFARYLEAIEEMV